MLLGGQFPYTEKPQDVTVVEDFVIPVVVKCMLVVVKGVLEVVKDASGVVKDVPKVIKDMPEGAKNVPVAVKGVDVVGVFVVSGVQLEVV
jgi:hypothetical protein